MRTHGLMCHKKIPISKVFVRGSCVGRINRGSKGTSVSKHKVAGHRSTGPSKRCFRPVFVQSASRLRSNLGLDMIQSHQDTPRIQQRFLLCTKKLHKKRTSHSKKTLTLHGSIGLLLENLWFSSGQAGGLLTWPLRSYEANKGGFLHRKVSRASWAYSWAKRTSISKQKSTRLGLIGFS